MQTYHIVVDNDSSVEFTRLELLESLASDQLDELLEKGSTKWIDADGIEHVLKLA